MTKETKANIERNEKLMNNLMTQTVYTKTQCFEKQANFYNQLSRFNQVGRHQTMNSETHITVPVNPPQYQE